MREGEGRALLFQPVLRQGRENENGLTFSAKKVGSAGRDLFAVDAALSSRRQRTRGGCSLTPLTRSAHCEAKLEEDKTRTGLMGWRNVVQAR